MNGARSAYSALLFFSSLEEKRYSSRGVFVPQREAFVDSEPGQSLTVLLEELRSCGLPKSQVQCVAAQR